MSLFYSPKVTTDNSLQFRQGNNPKEVPNQRQQDEEFIPYPYSGVYAGQLGINQVKTVPRGYEWPSEFRAGSSWFKRARSAMLRSYNHGNYELARPGITPGWPIGDRYTIYTRLRPVAKQPSPTNAPSTPKLGTAPAGFEYGSPYEW